MKQFNPLFNIDTHELFDLTFTYWSERKDDNNNY